MEGIYRGLFYTLPITTGKIILQVFVAEILVIDNDSLI